MDKTWLYALISTLFVSVISFSGVFLISLKSDVLKKILMLLVPFAIGALLGNTFFHLLPESYFHIENLAAVSWLTLGGFLFFLLIDQYLRNRKPRQDKDQIKSYGYLSLYADAFHNFTDGILIAVAWLASPELGLASTLAVALHEIPQEIGDFGVLLRAGFSKGKALLYNFYSASTAILGTLLALWMGEAIDYLSLYILPLAAGGFVYLAAANLLPEVLREASRRSMWLNFLFMLAGMALMFLFTVHGGHSH